jgi:hypothetical protein
MIYNDGMFDYRIKPFEFSPDLVRQVWASFIYKQKHPNEKIKVTGSHNFPKEISKQFADEYIVNMDCEPTKTYDFLIDSFNRSYTPQEVSKSLAFPKAEREIDEKYVCFIPNLAERWHPSTYDIDGRTTNAGGITVPFKYWLEYKKIVNDKGYKVYVMGNTFDVGYDNIPNYRDLGDYHLYKDTLDDPDFLYKQLKIMSNAELTLGMGGGSYIAPIFGLPCISSDVHYKLHFGNKTNLNNIHLDVFGNFGISSTQQCFTMSDKFVKSCLDKRL